MRVAGTSACRSTSSVGPGSVDRPAPLAARLRVEPRAQRREQPVHARIVEAARDRREHRHLVVGPLELGAVAPPLLAHVAQRVLGAALLELVQRDQVGEIEHVDLLELARRAVFARHHVHRHVDEVDDLGVALADARRLDDDQVEAGVLQQVEHVGQHGAGREVLAARRQRAHEHLLGRERVHADAVAEQRAAAAASRRVHRDDGDVAVREVPHEAHQQFVGQARLARAARAGDADDRRRACAARHGAAQRFAAARARPRRARAPRSCARSAGGRADRPGRTRTRPRRPRARAEDVVDHAVEAELAAVLRRVDALDAVGLELLDLVRRDGAAAAHDHADVLRAELAQHVHHVPEVLVVAALVGTAGDAVGVFLDRGAHDVGDAAVVAEVHDLGAVRLQQPADDVDGGVVAVEQRSGADEAQRRRFGRAAGSLLRFAFTADGRGCAHLLSSSCRARGPTLKLLLSRILPGSMIRAPSSQSGPVMADSYSSDTRTAADPAAAWRAAAGATTTPSAKPSSARPPAPSTSAAITTPRSTTSPRRSASPSRPSTTTSRTRNNCCSSASAPGSSRSAPPCAEPSRRAAAAATDCAGHPRLRGGHRLGIRLVHGARGAPGPGPGTERAGPCAQVRDRPGHPPAAAGRHRRRLDRRATRRSRRSRSPAR